jgi:hypothetical protein
MKAIASALIVAAALLSAACGEGRAIFNVDVHSFMAGSGDDTVPYLIPPVTTDTLSNPPFEINLPPGFGSSLVDTILITRGGARFLNDSGTGTIGFQIFLAATDTGTSNPAALAISIAPTAVSGPDTVAVPIVGDVSDALESLFTNSSLWVRVAAIASNGGATFVGGHVVIDSLTVRVVIQDKIF